MGDVVPFESATVTRIARLLVRCGAWHVKSTGVSKVGCPDIICCYKGHFLAIEVKSASGKTTSKQEHELRRVRQSGGRAIVARTVGDVQAVLDDIDGTYTV